ncbi:YcjX family protein [Stella sp.]|uniref:YcjX family protein n=1 Tax=Stella sp. TaxID=2912054 RepID=UPI0035B3EB69
MIRLPQIGWDDLKLPGFATRAIHGGTLRLAVTGLSRSGKSVFITALIHDLLAFPRLPARLPLFGAADDLAARVTGVEVALPVAADIPTFPFARNLRAMAAEPPHWPDGTQDVAEIAVDIRFRPGGFLHRSDAEATLRVVLVDYPGEWLLDLPMLDRDFAAWSADMLAMARQEPRAEAAADWLAFLAAHPPTVAHDELVAERAHDLYRGYLVRCRDRLGMAHLQPGRFLQPGDWSDPALLHFCPLPPGGGAGSLGAAMAGRFAAYKRAARERFFDRHFRRFDRQIVLVDLLQALHAGQAAFADTGRTLTEIAGAFRVGGGLLARLFGARIGRVLYAATKADHVPALQRDHLRQLLATLLRAPILDADSRGAETAVVALASVRCTEEDEALLDGRPTPVVRGVPLTGFRQVKFFPGTIPIKPPEAGDRFWSRPFFAMPRFQPPRLDPDAATGIGHVGLDEALDFLLADRLR